MVLLCNLYQPGGGGWVLSSKRTGLIASWIRISHLNRNRQVLGGLADWAGWRAGVLVVLVVLDKDKSLQRAGYKEIRPTRGGATTRQY
ncbi:hypothetical protein PG995_015288 [Apiospora arundinis]